MSSIQLYVELLLHIRTVTFYASLKTEHNKETKACLSSDGQTITLTHERESASIRLPTKIQGRSSAPLTLPASPAKELTFRLQLTEGVPGLLHSPEQNENIVPWPASSLFASTEVSCRTCGVTLIKKGAVSSWRDLPNENWAEMMEFWHCHKPDTKHSHDHDEVAQGKGYGASTKLQAQRRIGFVDLVSFLVSPDDCTHIRKGNESINYQANSQSLNCETCNAAVGVTDEMADGWRLYKRSLSLDEQIFNGRTANMEKWASAQLLAAIENEGIRKFIIEDGSDDNGILVWIFTPDLQFSSSVKSRSRHDPTRAMKIFWKPVEDPNVLLEKQSMTLEKLSFHPDVFSAIQSAFKRSAGILPPSARVFQDWRVGLLERFSEHDIEKSTNHA